MNDLRITEPRESVSAVSSMGSHAFVDWFVLAYHRAVAKQLSTEGSSIISHARRNLLRWIEQAKRDGGDIRPFVEWQRILDESDLARLGQIIIDVSGESQRLRSSSPFAGTLSAETRREILARCEQEATA